MKKEMDMTQLVDVFNDYTSTVFYVHNKIEKVWDRPGAVKKIPLMELYEVANTRGGRVLFQENMLLVKDSEIREFIGLEPLSKYTPTLEEIADLLQNKPIEELEEILQYCSDRTLEKVVESAISLPIHSLTKGSLIHEYSGINVVQAIEDRKEAAVTTSADQKTDTDTPPKRRKKVVE